MGNPIRILCLHGWKQSSGSFRHRLQPLISQFPFAEFYFCQGLFPIPGNSAPSNYIVGKAADRPTLSTSDSLTKRNWYSWWNVQKSENEKDWLYHGWESVCSYLLSAFHTDHLKLKKPVGDNKESGIPLFPEAFHSEFTPEYIKNVVTKSKFGGSPKPVVATDISPHVGFDFVIGFSQGSLVTILLSYLSQFIYFPRLKGVVLCSGFIPRDPDLQHFLRSSPKCQMPSLLLSATNDELFEESTVKRATSQLQEFFPNSSTFYHSERHNVPVLPENVKTIEKFVQSHIETGENSLETNTETRSNQDNFESDGNESSCSKTFTL